MWIARDEESRDHKSPVYVVFAKKPTLDGGLWKISDEFFDPQVAIRPSQSPIKLKPGDGPWQVRLVLDEG